MTDTSDGCTCDPWSCTCSTPNPTATTPIDNLIEQLIEQTKRVACSAVLSTVAGERSGTMWMDAQRKSDDLVRQLTARLATPTLEQIEAAVKTGSHNWNIDRQGHRSIATVMMESIRDLYPTQSKEAPE